MSNSNLSDQQDKTTKYNSINMTSSKYKLFASLAEYDIFYRWQRIHNSSDSMTNQNRKARLVDMKAPTRVNNESNRNTSIQHFIILKPLENAHKDDQTNKDQIKGRTDVFNNPFTSGVSHQTYHQYHFILDIFRDRVLS